MVFLGEIHVSISIHAPREGGDFQSFQVIAFINKFQSTPPARGATVHVWPLVKQQRISIHAPREGGDAPGGSTGTGQRRFQSTPPARGATAPSIWRPAHAHFNPRPPRGGRPFYQIHETSSAAFQSTPPARGATPSPEALPVIQPISIHAPREGGDQKRISRACQPDNFNPRPPRGGRQRKSKNDSNRTKFQSTPPARGATMFLRRGPRYLKISIHAPREGGDFTAAAGVSPKADFNPRPPRGGRRYVYAIFVVL